MKNVRLFCVVLVITVFFASSLKSEDLSKYPRTGVTAIVFKTSSRYNNFIQGQFERLLRTRLIEFPIGNLSDDKIVNEIKDFGLKTDRLLLVNTKEDIHFRETAARTGGKQGLWTSKVNGKIELYDLATQKIVSSRPVQIEKEYDDRGSALGNSLRNMAEITLGDIYYYEKTPEQKISYWLSDRVKEALDNIISELMKSGITSVLSKEADSVMNIDTKRSLFENSMDYLSRQITSEMNLNSKASAAVTEFKWIDGSQHDLEAFIAEELITRLTKHGKLMVVERKLLDKAVEELKFNLSDLFDPQHAKQFGRFTGADTIMVGTITDLSYKYKVNCRLIDTETGKVYGVTGVSIYHDERIDGLVHKE